MRMCQGWSNWRLGQQLAVAIGAMTCRIPRACSKAGGDIGLLKHVSVRLSRSVFALLH